MIDLQAELDQKQQVILVDDIILKHPIFLDQSGMELHGPVRINNFHSRTAFVVGWPRDLIPDDCWQPDGFHMKGMCHPYARGTAADLGPENGGWPALKVNLRIYFSALVDRPGALFGMNSGESYGPCPSPFMAYTSNGHLFFAVRTFDGIIQQFSIPHPETGEFEFWLNLNLVSGHCLLNNDPMTRDRVSWMPQLAPNSQAPFCIGWVNPSGNGSGSWGAEGPIRPAFVIHDYQVHGDGQMITRFYATEPRVPRLPIVPAPSSWFFIVHRDQEAGPSVSDVTLSNIKVENLVGNPAIVIGSVQGDFRLHNVRIIGCSRGIQSSGFGVAYPLTMTNCKIQHATDAAMFLHRASWIDVRSSSFNYSGRVGLHLLGCDGIFESIFFAPDFRESAVYQDGGNLTFRRSKANQEYVGRPFIRIKPNTWDQPWFPTFTEIDNCTPGFAPDGSHGKLYEVLPRTGTWYTGKQTLIVDKEIILKDA